MNKDSNNISKQFLYILTKTFLEKVDVNYKSLKKSTLFWILLYISHN